MATIGDIEAVLNGIAPLSGAEEWDNVGLLVGDRADGCHKILVCIDLSHAVLDEAWRQGANLLLCYHPPVFKPLARLRADCVGSESLVWRAARMGYAIYSPHTALDCAEGGTNDVLAQMCELAEVKPLRYGQAGEAYCKVVTFVPAANVEAVAEAMFAAGAGRIGQYHHCSFRLAGQGTFQGSESARPAVGQAGRLERVDEIRLEVVCSPKVVPEVIAGIRASHPYEEPAFDVYVLQATPSTAGQGRIGKLAQPTTVGQLAQRLAKAVDAGVAMLAGDASMMVQRVAILVGSAGRWALEQPGFAPADVLVTGELKHHDAIAYKAAGKAVIALGHWASERPALRSLAERVRQRVAGVEVIVSEADRDVWMAVV